MTYPSTADLPACPKCSTRSWYVSRTDYCCNDCDYRTNIAQAHRGFLSPPSRPIGDHDIQPQIIDGNPDDEDLAAA